VLKNYLIIGWRNLVRAAGFSLINIFGLAAGISVALLIGLWVYDELSFNKSFPNRDRITQVFHYITLGEEEMATSGVGYPYGAALKSTYPEFGEVCMSSGEGDHILAYDDIKVIEKGLFIDPSFLKIFSVNMQEGSHDALKRNSFYSVIQVAGTGTIWRSASRQDAKVRQPGTAHGHGCVRGLSIKFSFCGS
jgi:hypothetical protein